MAEKAAEAEARGGAGPRARLGEGRRLRFDDQAVGAPALQQGGGGGGTDASAPHERSVRSSLAIEVGELRPLGAEAMTTAEVVRALEAELGGSVRVTTALAVAAGRSAAAAALTSADSAPAIRAAAREWRGLLARVSAARASLTPARPPASWSEAADRLLQ
eukprot:1622933-Pleurochrysis_carterae.AAC.1